MRHFPLLFALPLLLVACYGEYTPPVDSEEGEAAPSENDVPEDEMVNIEMHLWPSNETPRQGQKPLLSIWAQRFTGSATSGSEWTFEGARAVAPAQKEGQSDIRFEAARGVFIEDKSATLTGGVTAYLNDTIIHLEDITWEINSAAGDGSPSGKAYTNNPVRIESPTQNLEATSMTLNPETADFELSDVTGEIHLGGLEQ